MVFDDGSYKLSVLKSNCTVTLTFDLEDQDQILTPMYDCVGVLVYIKINSLLYHNLYHNLSAICTMSLIFDLEDLGHILFLIIYYMQVQIKINDQ